MEATHYDCRECTPETRLFEYTSLFVLVLFQLPFILVCAQSSKIVTTTTITTRDQGSQQTSSDWNSVVIVLLSRRLSAFHSWFIIPSLLYHVISSKEKARVRADRPASATLPTEDSRENSKNVLESVRLIVRSRGIQTEAFQFFEKS